MARGHVWQGGHVWQILRDTVNERVLRILLDCTLVNTCEEYGVVLLV